MATHKFYPYGLSAVAAGDFDYLADTVNVALIATGGGNYVYNSAHSGLNFVSAAFRAVNGLGTLASKTLVASGTAMTYGAGDLTLNGVSANGGVSVFHAVATYRSGASEAASPLLAFNVLTSPITANGGNITLQFNAAGIARIWADD